MEDIVSVTVYKHISSLTGDTHKKEEDIFDPKRVTTSPSEENKFKIIKNLKYFR
jgi:hypothetical protein